MCGLPMNEETKLKRRKESRGTRLDAAKYRGRAKAHVPIRDTY